MTAAPSGYSAQPEGCEVPLRVLDGFAIVHDENRTTVATLSDIRKGKKLIALGKLVHLEGKQDKYPIQTEVLTDWLIEFGPVPSLWICTASAWYKLLKPNDAYIGMFHEAQRKLDFVFRALTVLRVQPAAPYAAIMPLLLQPQPLPPGMELISSISGNMYTEEDLKAEAGFLHAQISMWLQKADQVMAVLGGNLPPLLDDLAKLKGPEDEDEDEDEDDEDQKHLHRRGMGNPEKFARETQADLDRGSPPLPCTNFRVDAKMVPDVLGIWEFCMGFGRLLQLPPFPLRALEAAIMPGPLPFRTAAPPPVAAPPGGVFEEDEEDDGQQPADAGAATAVKQEDSKDGVHPVTYNPKTILDLDGTYAALLVRDIHSSLLKVIEGYAPKKPLDQPEAARPPVDDLKTEMWQERVCDAILGNKGHRELVTAEAKDAAEQLRVKEYALLNPQQRLTILKCLVEMTLHADALKEHVTVRPDAQGGRAGRPSPYDDEYEFDDMGVKLLQPARAGEAETPDYWMRWLECCRQGRHSRPEPGFGGPGRGRGGGVAGRGGLGRGAGRKSHAGPTPLLPLGASLLESFARVGVRKPVGVDFRRRRYWVLGGKGGCWRIFVESHEGGGWGWYEGASLVALVDWLRQGSIDREQPLLRALDAMPIPRKVSAEPLQPYPLPPYEQQPPANAPALLTYSVDDLERRRPDGYKLLPAPLLRGELDIVLPFNYKMGMLVDDRIQVCCEALMALIDFWAKPADWQAKMHQLLQQVKAAGRTGPNLAKAVLELEGILIESGLLKPEWDAQIRSPWRRSLDRAGLTAKDVAMHLAALQYFVAEQGQHSLTRLTFLRQAGKCPLYFPGLGETIVVLRSGLMLHLDKFARMAEHYAVDDLAAVKQTAMQMHAAERLKVVAVAYRSYPLSAKAAAAVDEADKAAAAAEAAEQARRAAAAEAAGMRPDSDGFVQQPVRNHGAAVRAQMLANMPPTRPPCMWMMAQRVDSPQDFLVLPIHIDPTLPDYVVRNEVYDKGAAKSWQPGERFRMYFQGKVGNRAGGQYYKGSVREVVPSIGNPNYDPWESISVVWDIDDGSGQIKVSPWEIENDPEWEKQQALARRKELEAQARAERVENKGRRGTSRYKDIIAQELANDDELSGSGSDAGEELESEDEDSDEEESDDDSDDSGTRHRSKARGGRGGRGGRGRGGAAGRGGGGPSHADHQRQLQQQQQQAMQQRASAQAQAVQQQQQQQAAMAQQQALLRQLQALQQLQATNPAALQSNPQAMNMLRALQSNPALLMQLQQMQAAQAAQAQAQGMRPQAGVPSAQQQQQMLMQQQQQQQQQQQVPQGMMGMNALQQAQARAMQQQQQQLTQQQLLALQQQQAAQRQQMAGYGGMQGMIQMQQQGQWQQQQQQPGAQMMPTGGQAGNQAQYWGGAGGAAGQR